MCIGLDRQWTGTLVLSVGRSLNLGRTVIVRVGHGRQFKGSFNDCSLYDWFLPWQLARLHNDGFSLHVLL